MIKNLNFNLVFCHQKPERSFFYKKKQFPICSRCTGIHLGYFSLPLFIFGFIKLPVLVTAIFIIPTYLDGALQAYYNIESNNFRRFFTGLFSGIGTMSFISITGIYLGTQILKLIN